MLQTPLREKKTATCYCQQTRDILVFPPDSVVADSLDVKLQNRLFILFISIWMMAGIDIIYLQIFYPPVI